MNQHQEITFNQNLLPAATTESSNKIRDMRAARDRRVLSIKAVWCSFIIGRRVASRRKAANSSAYVIDKHEEWLFPIMLGVIVLSISDAYMTVLLINNGAIEANPVMAFIIENYDNLFFLVKFTLTSVGIILLAALKNFTVFKYINGYHLITLILSVYTCLIWYEFMLLTSII